MRVREVPAATSLPSSARDLAIRGGLETAGVIFIDEEGSAGPGVRLRKPQRKTLSHPDPAAWGVVRNDGRDIHQENRSAGPGVRLRKPHYNFRQIERRLPVRLLDPA
jgi:hypothetical protein